MTRSGILLIPVAAVLLFASCIVSDQLTTLTIRADGSADWVRVRSNIRSSEAGKKGAEELKRFVEEFDRREGADFRRVLASGGEVLESRWLRREEPYANVVVARLPGASALETFYTFKGGKDGIVAKARFTESGRRRKLSIVIPPRAGETPEEEPTAEALRQSQADGISEMRIVVAGGRIVDSRGFTPASDRRSALLEPRRIHDLVARAEKDVEVFLEWELADE